MSEVHAALKRAEAARLLHFETKRPRVLLEPFKEFLFHGAKYAFPPLWGGMVADPPPVWPPVAGNARERELARKLLEKRL